MKKIVRPLIILIFFLGFIVSVRPQTVPRGYEELFHDQPEPVIPDNLLTIGIGQGKADPGQEQRGQGLGINIYYNPLLIDNGYVLDNGEIVCVGDEVYIVEDVLYGEWFGKGGPQDSPPIEFLSDLDEVKNNINDVSFQFKTYETIICTALGEDFCQQCLVNATVFCSSNCNTEPEDLTITYPGEGEVNFNCNIDCAMYLEPWLEGGEGSWAKFCNNFANMKSGPDFPPSFADLKFTSDNFKQFSLSLKYQAVQRSKGPELSVVSYSYNNDEDALYVEIENQGDTAALIDDISLDQNFEILYNTRVINPSSSGEILVSTYSESIVMTVKYRSDELGCLGKKDFIKNFYLGNIMSCLYDVDCSLNQICCEDYCHPSETGICDDTDRDGIPDTWVPI